MIEIIIRRPDGRELKFYGSNRVRAGRSAGLALAGRDPQAGYAFSWGKPEAGRECRLEEAAVGWYLIGGPVGLPNFCTDFRRAIMRLALAAARYASRDVGPGFLVSGPAGGGEGVAAFVAGQAGYWLVANPYQRQPDFFVVWGKGLSAEEDFGDIERLPDGSHVRGEASPPFLKLGGRCLMVQTVAFLGDGPIPSREGDE